MVNIGIIANPASGKDVRRLVARASVIDNPEKQAIVQRLIAGMEGVLGDSDWQIWPTWTTPTASFARRSAASLARTANVACRRRRQKPAAP